MIYDITDIINDTHQFSCLIEGGCGAYPGTTKGHCPENVKTPHYTRTPHPQVTSFPLFPLFLPPSRASLSSSSATVSLRFHLSGLLNTIILEYTSRAGQLFPHVAMHSYTSLSCYVCMCGLHNGHYECV